MPILYKLKHLPATLAFFQKGSWSDDSLEKETKQLEALLHTYDQINPLRDLDTVLSNGYRKEDFLAKAVEYYGKHLMRQKDRGAR